MTIPALVHMTLDSNGSASIFRLSRAEYDSLPGVHESTLSTGGWAKDLILRGNAEAVPFRITLFCYEPPLEKEASSG
jgi:hypothetical protein